MTDFTHALAICHKTSRYSEKLIDNFLMYYAAERENMEREMASRLAPYKKVIRQVDNAEWLNKLKAQYIVHRIFRKDGLIRKYLPHTALKNLSGDEREFLQFQARNPWRFSFSIIAAQPAPDFYEMEDVFRGSRFLLYSPGSTETIKGKPVALWFNLIAFNGNCWQTFGPINAYSSFDPDDIFFFATERNRAIGSEEELMNDVEANPFPYAMLTSGAELPGIISKENPLVYVTATHDWPVFSTDRLAVSFTVEYNKSVYRLSLKAWQEMPHFAVAYYDEKRKSLLLTAMTDRGFNALVMEFNRLNYAFPIEPDVRVSLSMLSTTEKILDKKIVLNPYEKLFEKTTTPGEKKELTKMNELLAMMLPDLNAGREPDIDVLALRTGLDPATIREISKSITASLRKSKGKQ